MATELETRTSTTTSTGRRIFTGLNQDNVRTEYRRPNFSSITFDNVEEVDIQTSYDTTVEEISVDTPKKMDMLTVDKTIEQRPQTPLRVRLNARGRIIVSVLAICICALVAFMIGNIVTINNLNGVIAQKQELVLQQQQTVSDLQQEYDDLGNNIQQNASDNGYVQIDTSQVTEIGNVDVLEKPSADIEGNWFDSLCNWLSELFN